MNTVKKRIVTIILVAIYALTLLAVLPRVLDLNWFNVFAESETYEYFYENLTVADSKGVENEYTLAKKFYKALDDINKSGDFKDGIVDYSLTDNKIVNSNEIKEWVLNGDITIPRAFGAARDAYLTDHPEVFYIDFYKLTISAARSNGVYSAYIDSGREANCYYDDGFKSEAEVNAAIAALNKKVNEIADAAIAFAEKDTYGTAKEVLQAIYVNRTLAKEINYDYGSYDDYVENGIASASSVSTAYGGLVLNKAVCGGYARSFKLVMDKLGIPCVVVNGFGLTQNDTGRITEKAVMHAWNYVYLPDPAEAGVAALTDITESGKWYAVDVTWNSTGNKGDSVESKNYNKYMNMGSFSQNKNHIVDGEISSSGYVLKYPEIAAYDYGCNTNSEGLSYSAVYNPTGGTDDFGNDYVQLMETVSYNGKSAIRLLMEDNLHMAVRYASFKDGALYWTVWMDIAAVYTSGALAGVEGLDNGAQSIFPGNASTIYSQFAVIETEPTLNYNPDLLGPDGKPIIPPEGSNIPNMFYDYNEQPGEHMSAISEIFENQSYGTYAPAPYVKNTNYTITEPNIISDSMKSPDSAVMDEKYAKVYEISYDEPLHILDETAEIGIFFTTKHANAHEYAKLVPFESGKFVEFVDEHTLRFKFMPSLMYEHNGERYTFTFTNIGSSEIKQRPKRDENNQIIHDESGNVVTEDYMTNKLPNSVSFSFARVTYACPKYFGYDGRLYIDCCAQPTLVDNSDLSAMDFKDEEGNSTFSETKRSQMMLVVNNVSENTENTMLDEISGSSEINVDRGDIHKSETYDIRLQICNKYPIIPDGSFVRIALGFPEGYGPKDEGVTFKIFHRKHDPETDTYTIEEVPCVVTQFGIVATVTSFSPYMVAVVNSDKAGEDKTVYATVEGKGGKILKEEGMVRTVKQGENCVYTVVPDEGYAIYSVTLNGKDVTDKVQNGKLTLSYGEMDSNNEVEIKYISSEAAKRYESKGVELVSPVKVYIPVEGLPPIDVNVTPDSFRTFGLVAAIVVVVIAIVAVIAVAVVKKKESREQSE